MDFKKSTSSRVNMSWGGRFKDSPDKLTDLYTGSQQFDRALFHEDILASKAHARMLAKQGILPGQEVENILSGLDQIEQEIESGIFTWHPELEDVHMNIEARLTELIGESGKKLHTGRSRNDQVGLTFRLHVAKRMRTWQSLTLRLCQTLCEIATENVHSIMPGFTHLQPAQPVTLAQHLLAYAGMFKRDVERIDDALKRTEISPLGAAALAGTTFPLDPCFVAEQVGFSKIYQNSMDAVSDRDFVLEALFIACAIMMHVSRLSEEIIIWASPAFGFIKLPDAFSTGSSIMPQKKNPDVAELARGKTGRVYGNLMALLTTMKGLPLAYNKDLQEDKETFFDTASTIEHTLLIMAPMMKAMYFDKEKMLNACQKGFLNATEIADYLAGKGFPFREAHHITGKIVSLAETLNKPLEKLNLEDFKSVEPAIGEDIFATLDYNNAVARRESPGGTGPNSIRHQLEKFTQWFNDNKDRLSV